MITVNRKTGLFRCCQKGFTLLETVLVLLLIGWVGLAAFLTVPAWITQWHKYVLRQDLLSEATAAVDRMSREIRGVQDRAHVSTASESRLVFTDTYGHTIDYQYAGHALTRRLDAGAARLLAANVSDFTFTYLGFHQDHAGPEVLPSIFTDGYTNIRLVRMQMSLQREGETVTIRTAVAPRNLQMR